MRDVPLGLVASLLNAAVATVDFILFDPQTDAHAATGFEAMWRMIA